LGGLLPDFLCVEQLCEQIGSTGLYPYARADRAEQTFEARQFPKSSGYREDAATGIAATALAFGLLAIGVVSPTDRPIHVLQGRAMGRPSKISVRFRIDDGGIIDGCWVGGGARLESVETSSFQK
jgi:predicted PhzF superfamily epimerase YddE/YHI9